MTTREEQISSIRQLADWLEEHPEVPVPHSLRGGAYDYLTTVLHGDQRSTLAAIARALPGKVDKATRGTAFDLIGWVGCIRLVTIANRDEVCQRVVTGTREVTKTVPDPAVEVPLVEVTETVEDVEWVCGPLLAEASA